MQQEMALRVGNPRFVVVEQNGDYQWHGPYSSTEAVHKQVDIELTECPSNSYIVRGEPAGMPALGLTLKEPDGSEGAGRIEDKISAGTPLSEREGENR